MKQESIYVYMDRRLALRLQTSFFGEMSDWKKTSGVPQGSV